MDSRQVRRPSELLFVEDNPGDVQLTKQALENGHLFHLHVVHDGEAALKFLSRVGEYDSAPAPDLVLLDLNLPKKDGRQVLEEMKDRREWKRIPVVVLTTSSAEEDIARCYELHANCYVTKPTGLQEFNAAVRAIEKFWLTIAQLPPPRS